MQACRLSRLCFSASAKISAIPHSGQESGDHDGPPHYGVRVEGELERNNSSDRHGDEAADQGIPIRFRSISPHPRPENAERGKRVGVRLMYSYFVNLAAASWFQLSLAIR